MCVEEMCCFNVFVFSGCTGITYGGDFFIYQYPMELMAAYLAHAGAWQRVYTYYYLEEHQRLLPHVSTHLPRHTELHLICELIHARHSHGIRTRRVAFAWHSHERHAWFLCRPTAKTTRSRSCVFPRVYWEQSEDSQVSRRFMCESES